MANSKAPASGMSPEEVALRLFEYIRQGDGTLDSRHGKAEILQLYADCIRTVRDGVYEASWMPPDDYDGSSLVLNGSMRNGR
jgi:hypothetical protein